MSDVHLGHRTTDTVSIVQNLTDTLLEANLDDADLIIIAGDLFDRLLHLSFIDLPVIYRWLTWLLRICKKYDILLRVLEGTPSHDNKQATLMSDINNESDIGCDFKYIDTLMIEHISRFDITVLYIPDEYHPECSQTLHEVRELMANKMLSQVDFAVMHGQFDYQVPFNLLSRIPHHSSEAYLELVRYLIFIGHVHTHSQLDRIFAAGSFDRLRHGEEEDKGLIKVTVYNTGAFDATFIVNKRSKIYKTIDVTDLDLTSSLERITNIADKVPNNSFLRIKAQSGESITNSLKELKVLYPDMVWTLVTEKAVNYNKQLPTKERVVMDNLRQNTLPKLLEARMHGKHSDNIINGAVTLLKDIIDDTPNPTGNTG